MLYIEKVKYRNKIKYIGFISNLVGLEYLIGSVPNRCLDNLHRLGRHTVSGRIRNFLLPLNSTLKLKDCVFDNKNDLLTNVNTMKKYLSNNSIVSSGLNHNYRRLTINVHCHIIRHYSGSNDKVLYSTRVKVLNRNLGHNNMVITTYKSPKYEHYRSTIARIRKRYPYVKIRLEIYRHGQLRPEVRIV
ncbi:MAG: hypothetical protein BAJALOKI3v1_50040 [Promethearchaeota archaeon]|nr:MAG: hypothetical protein BAJALOKI3v1_50040 [Candidatus Lokiarchaeota archaeon]